MSRNFRSALCVLCLTLFTAAARAETDGIAWPKTPFSQGLNLPATLPAQRALPPGAAACGSSTCSSIPDTVCGQCSIACPLGKASTCYPGQHTEDLAGKASCAQRPACSCN